MRETASLSTVYRPEALLALVEDGQKFLKPGHLICLAARHSRLSVRLALATAVSAKARH
jgi:hypothetical protein